MKKTIIALLAIAIIGFKAKTCIAIQQISENNMFDVGYHNANSLRTLPIPSLPPYLGKPIFKSKSKG